ncbi:MAG: histidinol dehydrogenase, partial [Planctomycetota bacterium]|nr:histidinol dehydrogenase [Planctomycetota bacterium]
MATLQIIQFGTEEGQAPLNKIRQRFVEQLSQASATATQKTVEVFGEAITPLESVRRIIDAVRERGDEAVLDFSKKLDRFDFDAGDLRVSEDEIEAGYENVDSGIRETLHRAAANIRRFQQHIKIQSPPVLNMGDRRLGVAYRPLDSAGLYIPGGTAAYPSTVLMTAIPAAVAGVKRIALCCLPGKGGNHAPEVLAAARIAG